MSRAEHSSRLLELRSQKWFQDFKREVLAAEMPKIPPFSPGQTDPDNWKYASGLVEGYLYCLRQFGIRPEDL